MSKYTLNPDNVKFFVDEEKRTVVCTILHTKHVLVNFIQDNCHIDSNCDEDWYWHNHQARGKLERKLMMPNRFVGVAVCGPDDEWDEDFGKYLAYDRARQKFDNSFFKHAQTYITEVGAYLDAAVDTINEYGDKVAHNAKYRDEFIKKQLGESET